jgi:hypothetical protein
MIRTKDRALALLESALNNGGTMSTYLPTDVHDALERFIHETHPGLNQTEAIILILRKALVHQGYLAAEPEHGTPPEDLNATNDD